MTTPLLKRWKPIPDKPRILVNTVYNIFLEEKDQRRKEYWKELGEASYEGSTWEEDPETGDWVRGAGYDYFRVCIFEQVAGTYCFF